jgi:hypothetical protein
MNWKHLIFRRIAIVVSVFVLLLLSPVVYTAHAAVHTSSLPKSSADPNDFVQVDFRVDLPTVYQSNDFITNIETTALPAAGNGFTDAYLGITLAKFKQGVTYSAQFSQVGLLTDSTGVRWFMYAEPGVTCERGTPAWIGSDGVTRGCLGDYNDLVGLGVPGQFELVTYSQGYWIARVWNSITGARADVAMIHSSSTRIYTAHQTGEEAYNGNDTYLTMAFYHWHPQYMTAQGWVDWPASSGNSNNNSLFVSPRSICPRNYGAHLNWSVTGSTNDPRYWFTGNGGTTCNAKVVF